MAFHCPGAVANCTLYATMLSIFTCKGRLSILFQLALRLLASIQQAAVVDAHLAVLKMYRVVKVTPSSHLQGRRDSDTLSA